MKNIFVILIVFTGSVALCGSNINCRDQNQTSILKGKIIPSSVGIGANEVVIEQGEVNFNKTLPVPVRGTFKRTDLPSRYGAIVFVRHGTLLHFPLRMSIVSPNTFPIVIEDNAQPVRLICSNY